jgi:hypothetical protein
LPNFSLYPLIHGITHKRKSINYQSNETINFRNGQGPQFFQHLVQASFRSVPLAIRKWTETPWLVREAGRKTLVDKLLDQIQNVLLLHAQNSFLLVVPLDLRRRKGLGGRKLNAQNLEWARMFVAINTIVCFYFGINLFSNISLISWVVPCLITERV